MDICMPVCCEETVCSLVVITTGLLLIAAANHETDSLYSAMYRFNHIRSQWFGINMNDYSAYDSSSPLSNEVWILHFMPLALTYIELLHLVSSSFAYLFWIFSERERYMSSSVRLSVRLSSVTFVHPTQPIEIFRYVSTPFNTLVIWRHTGKILRWSSQGNPSVGGVKPKRCRDI